MTGHRPEREQQPVIVWGNCQAAPIADLMRPALATAGLQVLDVEPVYLLTADAMAAIRPLLQRCAIFVTQPVREAAYGGGRGSDTVIEQLPDDCAVVHIPVTYDTSAFPFQVYGHGADGARVNAPITDYHDLRTAVAAAHGMTSTQAAAWWPAPSTDGTQHHAAASRAELRHRELSLDVHTSDLLDDPAALWTMTHPTNGLLARKAQRVLEVLHERGVLPAASPVEPGEREYLGERRAPVEAAVAQALGWPSSATRETWTVDGRALPLVELLEAHLELYAKRPDVVADLLHRHAERLQLLGVPV
ncbi:WcbI family polysaccharide biosynthesis putative acetyltransferase [uncultured Jatrophihabitans sp.]|uniref:WcbI family polysaccharide biosynthesis putative acetyltransferase n=1 Tax=uncultured Jatrophihabitans sp. TaxID=1610747 RepID=UPI0035C9E78F